MANNKFKLTLTIFAGILIFLFFSGVLPNFQLSLNSQEQFNQQTIDLAQNQGSGEQESQECNQCNWWERFLEPIFPNCQDEKLVTNSDGNPSCCPANLYHDGKCNDAIPGRDS